MSPDPDLPPAVQIAVDEKLWDFRSGPELERHLRSRGLIAELRRQARWSRSGFEYADRREDEAPRSSDLVVTPSGTLNPFSPVAKCSSPSCRARAAADFIQSVALYSDVAYLPDPLSSPFSDPKKLSGDKAEYLQHRLETLRTVYPLIQAGIVRLASPFRAYCRHCFDEIGATLDEATEAVAAAIEPDIRASYYPKGPEPYIFIRTPVLFPEQDHPLSTVCPLSPEKHRAYLESCGDGRSSRNTRKSRRLLVQFLRSHLRRDIQQIFHELTLAQGTKSLLLAGSRIEPFVLAHLDGSLPSPSELQQWESLRTIELPWLHELTAEEVLTLRHEAATALPRLRDLLLRRVASGDPVSNVTSVIEELKDQLNEVEDELASINLGRQRRYGSGMGVLSMLFVVYGVSSGAPQLAAASIATFFATLAHLRGAERDHDSAVAKLEAKPAYALFKGKKIVEQR